MSASKGVAEPTTATAHTMAEFISRSPRNDPLLVPLAMDISQLRGLRGSKRFLKPAALVADVDRFLDAEAPPDRTKDASVGMESSETKAAIGWTPGKKKRQRRPSRQQLRAKNQRDTDNSKILNLTLDVNNLRQQVHDCLVQKSVWATRQLVAREQFHARSLRSVGRFFQLFQYGYPELLPVDDQQFLAALLDESILVGDGVKGQQQFFEQWRRYKKLFSVRLISTCSMKVIASDFAGCLIECAGTFEGCVTAASLQSVFPSALEDDALVEQVIGRHFTCPTKTLISLDADGRLVQYDAYSDMFKAMSDLLDFDPFRVVTIMENAMISEGSLLPPVDRIYEANDAEYFLDACRDEHMYGRVGVDSAQLEGPDLSKNSIDFILC